LSLAEQFLDGACTGAGVDAWSTARPIGVDVECLGIFSQSSHLGRHELSRKKSERLPSASLCNLDLLNIDTDRLAFVPVSCPDLTSEFLRKKTAKDNRRQFYRYLLVGGSSFLLEYGLFYILLVLDVNYLVANSIVYSTVTAINFALNRLWTFRSTKNLRLQISLYLSLLLFNFIASNVMLYILSGQLNIPPLWSKIGVMAMIVVWNFVIYKKRIYN
jgi:putative flippase GtrA